MPQDIINPSKFKSSKLNNDNRTRLRRFTARFLTYTEAAAAIGISRQVLRRVMRKGRGSPGTITKVVAALYIFEK